MASSSAAAAGAAPVSGAAAPAAAAAAAAPKPVRLPLANADWVALRYLDNPSPGWYFRCKVGPGRAAARGACRVAARARFNIARRARMKKPVDLLRARARALGP